MNEKKIFAPHGVYCKFLSIQSFVDDLSAIANWMRTESVHCIYRRPDVMFWMLFWMVFEYAET